MNVKTKIMLVLGVMVCFGLALSAPVTFAADQKPTKETTMTKPRATKKVVTTKKKMTAKKTVAAKKTKVAQKTMHHKSMVKASAEVKKAQEALIKDGAKIKADGLMGKHTRAALKTFQKKNHLKVNGRLDKETVAKLI